jgi:hypothetical protein
MPRMGFELTIPVFEQAKTFHTLDRCDRPSAVTSRLQLGVVMVAVILLLLFFIVR